ncbi:hypothetical protein [Mycoplasma sp. 4044]
MTKSSKILLSLSGILGIAVSSSTIALALQKQDFDKNKNDFYKTFDQSKDQFQTYKDVWNFSPEVKEELNKKTY